MSQYPHASSPASIITCHADPAAYDAGHIAIAGDSAECREFGMPTHSGDFMQPADFDVLREQAAASGRQAYAPYSGLHVGAALRSASGHVYCGCNVENGALPMNSCAERGAIAAAVLAEGPTFRLSAIAVVATTADGSVQAVSPCGACRQLIAESGPEASIGFFGANEQWVVVSAAELLPYAFVLPRG